MKLHFNRLIFPCLILGTLLAPVQVLSEDKIPGKELEELDRALRSAHVFEQKKSRAIDSVLRISIRKDKSRQRDAMIAAAEGYRSMNADSALHYSSLALQLSESIPADRKGLLRSRISMVTSLAAAGIFTEARSRFEALLADTLPEAVKPDLWKAGRQLYSYMMGYVAGENIYRRTYQEAYRAYDDSLMRVLPATDRFRRFINAERMVSDGNYSDARIALNKLLKELPDDSNLYGMAAYQMAETYRLESRDDEFARYLVKAALSDVKGGVSDGLALPQLAGWLYYKGELAHAFDYINFALESATAGGARMRPAAIARLMPLIDESYHKRMRSSRDRLVVLLTFTLALLVICVFLIVEMVRQHKSMKQVNVRLGETGRLLESYVANFFGMCTAYVDKLDSLCKLVSRKISAGQTDDLLRMLKSGKITDENDDFFRYFDNAFLDIYPNFPVEVNSLLRPDAQLPILSGHTLSSELRIYALVRLGVTESMRIAHMLHYSVNTVYTYRNRMRNRALNRESFESEIMQIGSNEAIRNSEKLRSVFD